MSFDSQSQLDPPLPPNFKAAPAPWDLPNAQSWWFITSLIGGGGNDVAPGNFDDLEVESRGAAKGGNFKGGLGTIMIVRYTETPVGPYDELMIIPGKFKAPSGSSALRITRIYVSSLASIANGRHNWNIPKHLAKFSFIPSEKNPKATEVRIYATTSISADGVATYNEEPFFAALISPSTLPIPAIPLNVKYLPIALTLVQPPLESSPSAEEDGCVGTKTWKSTEPGFQGKIEPVNIQGLLDGRSAEPGQSNSSRKRIANGVDFPDVSPYTTGIWWPVANITFPESKNLGV